MPTDEERFRELLQRLGFKPSRVATQQLFRNDSAVDILSWVLSNVTEKNFLHPEMIRDYEELQTTNSSALPDSPRSSLRSLSKWDELGLQSESELLRKREELENHFQQRDEQKKQLTELRDHLETQLNRLDEKMKLSYQEEDQLVNDLVVECHDRAAKMCDDLDSNYRRFSNQLTDFTHLMNTQGSNVSELRKVEQILKKQRFESEIEFLNKSVGTQSFLSSSGDDEIEAMKSECECMSLKKQSLLKTELPIAIANSLECFGFDLLQDYIPKICVEWNGILLQKQQLLDLAASQLDRARLFKILADVELQQLNEMIQYLQKLGQNFKQTAENALRRKAQYGQSSKGQSEFVQHDDHYLQSLSAFLKFCVREAETNECLSVMELSRAKQGSSSHKRQYSIAFSSKTSINGIDSPRISPVSKMIKEQQSGILTTPIHEQETRSTNLEQSLRRLSMAPASSITKDSLFQDSPPNQVPEVSLDELSLHGNRVLSLIKNTNQGVVEILPDSLFKKLIESTDGICSVYNRIFLINETGLVLSSPNLDKSFEGCDQLIEELNKTSGELKGQFRSLMAYLERQTQEAESRDALIKFYTK
eukprot:g2583.t1